MGPIQQLKLISWALPLLGGPGSPALPSCLAVAARDCLWLTVGDVVVVSGGASSLAGQVIIVDFVQISDPVIHCRATSCFGASCWVLVNQLN
jgi:hypothetical protein